MMTGRLSRLAELARQLPTSSDLEEVLAQVVGAAAELLAFERVSIRLLDASRTKLLAVCRAGSPLHENPQEVWRLGEGLLGWIADHGEAIRTGSADTDPRFVPRADMKERLVSFLGVPLVAGKTCIGVLSAVHSSPDRFTPEDEELVLLLSAIAAPYVEIARLSRLSQVDRLTGALNRRGLDDSWPRIATLPRLSVAMIDLDHFKAVNDTHGHAAGDEILREVVRRLGDAVRREDSVVRYGGEEFLLVAPVGLEAMCRIAERARKCVAGSPVRAGELAISITISIGVAERAPDETRDQVLARADHALYAAKQSGRDRVHVAR